MTLAEGFDLSLFHPLTVVALNIDMHNIYAIIIIFGVLHYNLSEFVLKKQKEEKLYIFLSKCQRIELLCNFKIQQEIYEILSAYSWSIYS